MLTSIMNPVCPPSRSLFFSWIDTHCMCFGLSKGQVPTTYNFVYTHHAGCQQSYYKQVMMSNATKLDLVATENAHGNANVL